MVAGVGRVVARGAGAGDGGRAERVVEALHAGDVDGLRVEQRLAAGHRAPCDGDAAVAAFGVGPARVGNVGLPVRVQRHYDGREVGVRAVVAGQRIVDAEVVHLVRQERRAAVRAVGGEAAGVVVAHLRRGEAHLERDDGLALRGRQRRRALGVRDDGGVRLVDEVEVLRREAGGGAGDAVGAGGVLEGLAAVPHHGAEEADVGGGQRAAEQRQLGGGRVAVRIVDARELEVRAGRNRQPDADHAVLEQHAVGLLARGPRGHVGAGRVGAVHQAEDRILAVGGLEALAHAVRRDRPALVGLVARLARAAVAAQAGEERVLAVDAAGGADGERLAAAVAVQLRAIGARAVVAGRDDPAEGEREEPGDGHGHGRCTHLCSPTINGCSGRSFVVRRSRTALLGEAESGDESCQVGGP